MKNEFVKKSQSISLLDEIGLLKCICNSHNKISIWLDNKLDEREKIIENFIFDPLADSAVEEKGQNFKNDVSEFFFFFILWEEFSPFKLILILFFKNS